MCLNPLELLYLAGWVWAAVMCRHQRVAVDLGDMPTWYRVSVGIAMGLLLAMASGIV